ncbi:MAG: mechanosensitive ion channel protein MscS, partial [Bradyrhizobium sp.]|nr:mechanosensitive ion channel protein MscS [Bradyrhizobium sp.]
MEMSDIIDFLHAAARSVGAEVTSPWFYLQLGLVMAGAGISFAAGTAIRARTDMSALAKEWPAPLRMMARVLVAYSSTAVFAVLMRAARMVMVASTWPSRSYLLAISAKLALAWLVIRMVTSVIHNEFIVKLVSVSAWLVAALSVVGQLEPALDLLDSDSVAIVLGGLRLTPLLLIKAGALLILALWLTNIASNFAES